MPDIVDKKTRSRMMSGIRGKNTKPELLIRSALHRDGFRFRVHVQNLPGKPDIVLPRYRAVIFVHGCFWHGHDCNLFKWPSTRPDWWRAKIERTRINDEAAVQSLLDAGWRVAEVWECALKGREHLNEQTVINRLSKWLRQEDETQLTVRGEVT